MVSKKTVVAFVILLAAGTVLAGNDQGNGRAGAIASDDGTRSTGTRVAGDAQDLAVLVPLG